jgi:hypothetical protein
MKKSYGKRFKQTCLAYFLVYGKLFKFALSIIPMDIMLSDKEVRVLGCLIEKELSTPEYYPLSINPVTAR